MSEDLPDFWTLAELIQQLSAEVGRDFSTLWDTGVVGAGATVGNVTVVPADRDYYVVQAWCTPIAQIAFVQRGLYTIENLTEIVRWGSQIFEAYWGAWMPLAKPFRARAGASINENVTNLSAANARYLSGFAGYYILV